MRLSMGLCPYLVVGSRSRAGLSSAMGTGCSRWKPATFRAMTEAPRPLPSKELDKPTKVPYPSTHVVAPHDLGCIGHPTHDRWLGFRSDRGYEDGHLQ